MDLSRVEELYGRGSYLQAYEAGLREAPLERWTGVRARTLAGRLARHLGAPRLSHVLFMLAYRDDRSSPLALCYYAASLAERRGPLAGWRFLEARGDLPDADAEVRVDWFGLHSAILATLRDFERAEDWLRRAEDQGPQRPWILIERATLCFASDDAQGALEAGRAALDVEPWYRPGVECVASALIQLGCDEEALLLLREASERLECARVTGQLLSVLLNHGLLAEADATTRRLERLMPLADEGARRWLAGLRSDLAYQRGDVAQARALLEDAPEGFYRLIRERLAAPDPDVHAVRLEVPFVRQDYLTCAPATLAALGAYWSSPVSHAEIARTICYGGTPDHAERHWAESNGWRVREFSVDWDSARALLERGVPFTLTTVGPAEAHLQAIVGYDARRGTVLLRDPNGYVLRECIASALFDSYRSTGPRGMVLVPAGEAHRLEGLALPDEAVYDLVYAMKRDLAGHRREDAQRRYEDLVRDHRDHTLTLRARWELALYDRDLVAALCSVDELLQRFPGDQPLVLRRVALLRDLHHREASLEALEEILARPDADGIFWQQRAEALRGDARHWEATEACLAQALRVRPTDPHVYSSLAALRMAQRRFDLALDLYRFAACLSPADEFPSQAYFNASRANGRPEEGLAFLRRRATRASEQSGLPATTLAWALGCLGRRAEGLEVLEEAMRLRPGDAELRLAAAAERGRAGDRERATRLLAKAEGGVKRSAWLRTAAELAGQDGRGEEALAMWRQVCDVEPMDDALARQVALQIAVTEGPEAVTRFLREALDRAPRNVGIGVLWVRWLRNRERDAAAREAAKLAERHPMSVLAWLTLGEILLDQRRLDEAEEAAEEALHLDPLDPGGDVLRGRVFAARGDRTRAAECLRAALRRDIDAAHAIQPLVQCYETDAGRREALAFASTELERQVVFGDGLVAYRAAARAVLEPREVAGLLADALSARPDLWQAWSESVRQMAEMGDQDEALRLALAATERFPLVAEAWSDLALVQQLRSDPVGRRHALEKGLEVSPAWSWAHRELALLHRDAGRLPEAREGIERAIACAPLEEANLGCLADIQWAEGDKQAAVESLGRALLLNPAYEWAWNQLRQWGTELGTPGEAARVADALVARRPDDVRSWLAVARLNVGPATLEKRLGALEEAARCDPNDVDVHDQKAAELAEAGRFEEALAACRPDAFGPVAPVALRGRAAWVEDCRGNRAAAMESMRRLVDEDPGYAWGWWQLAIWQAEDRRWEAAAADARRLVRVVPGSADAWLLVGRLELRLGNRDGAKSAFGRALDLEPYKFEAGLLLFDQCLESREHEEAHRALSRVSPYAPVEEILTRRLQAALAHGDPEEAAGHFRELCQTPGDDPEPLERASRLLSASPASGERNRILDEALDWETVPLRALVLCGRRAAEKRGPWNARERRFLEACDRLEGGMQALAQYVEHLVALRRRRHLRRLVSRERERLRSSTWPWASVGYALTTLERPRRTVAWLSDWETRPDLQPWMLLNLVVSLRALDRWPEAARVGRHALGLEADHSRAPHATWLALDAALEGHCDDAERMLELAGQGSERAIYPHLLALTQLLVSARGGEANRRELRRRARPVLSAARRAAKRTPLLRQPYRRARRELRRLCARR